MKDGERGERNVIYPAHIRMEADGTEAVQTVFEHNRNVAEIAQRVLEPIGLGRAAFFAGLLHDIGKLDERFAEYLYKHVRQEADAPARGSVNHTFASVRLLLGRWHGQGELGALAVELMAFAVGAHHGLFDLVDEQGKSGFLHRMTAPDIADSNILRELTREIPLTELDERCGEACAELEQKIRELCDDCEDDPEAFCMALGLLARLLLSAVIEGDRRDTANFMAGRDVVIEEPRPAWKEALAHLEVRLAGYAADTPVNRIRAEISERCAKAAYEPGGIIRLTVSTGGGKTLSTLRYALAHAEDQKRDRILFVMPLLAIIEQNAAEIRRAVGNTVPVLEHHSDVVNIGLTPEALDERELLCENWRVPGIIVTTLVQLLHTFFSGKTSCIRRFQALCNSVIVIDEVQTVPTHMLSMFNAAIQFLADDCGTTIILCSATQPCLEAVKPSLRGVRNMIEEDLTQRPELRRTVIRDGGSMTEQELSAWVAERMQTCETVLVICNTKETARSLYALLKEAGMPAVHLSASMCHAHRRAVMERIRWLRKGEKLVCVSTQVMEAGVDVSFQCVVRISAGMDSVVQAAGRCNRHGESKEPQDVWIVRLMGERLSQLREIEAAQQATVRLLEAYRARPERYANDLTSGQAIEQYYRELYGAFPEKHTEYYEREHRCTLYDLLAVNRHGGGTGDGYHLRQAFKLAGELFSVFDSETVDVLVPYGEGRLVIEALGSERAAHDRSYAASLLEQAKPYTIRLYRYEMEAVGCGLQRVGALGILALDGFFYDDDVGFLRKRQTGELWEV